MKSNFYISFGIWIALLPFLGIPGAWRNTLITLSGIFLVLVAAGPLVLKKLQSKQKPVRKKKDTAPAQTIEASEKEQEKEEKVFVQEERPEEKV